MEQRENAGYIITESIKVKNTEFVLGEQPETGMFVTWQCKNGTDYYWGHYADNRYAALKDFCERAAREIDYLSSIQAIPPIGKPQKSKERER